MDFNYNPGYNQYPNNQGNRVSQQFPTQAAQFVLREQSFIENILRLNIGKVATIYQTFPDSMEWRDKIFRGVIEQAGVDHIILSDPTTGKYYILLMLYLDYITFDEPIKFIQFPLNPTQQNPLR